MIAPDPRWEGHFPAPKGESRTYVVGLPVLITVWDDGTVVYDVATEEAGAAVWEDGPNMIDAPDDDTIRAAPHLIEADHERRRERGDA